MGDPRVAGILILGTSPSQNILLTIFLPNWFLLSRQGLKSLNLLVNWNRAMWLGATKKELDKRP